MSLNGGNMIKCAKCSSLDVVKNGFAGGKQRYKCGKCGYQFTTEIPRGKPISLKLLVHGLYECGFSMRKTAQIAGVTVQTVSRWINISSKLSQISRKMSDQISGYHGPDMLTNRINYNK